MMDNHGCTEQDAERLSAFVLGVLSPEEQAAVERHLQTGCDACAQEVAALREIAGRVALAAPAVPAPTVLRERLHAEIRRERETAGVLLRRPGLLIARPSDARWEATDIAGVFRRRLFEDPARRYATALVRMEPGVRYPAHRHVELEELYLLEGDLHVQGVPMRPGDYCRADAGTVHDEVFTDTGAVFIVMSSELNELLASL